MPGLTPTGRDLYERLSSLLGTETEEELAVKLGESARQVQRLKRGFGKNQQKLLDLLFVAGWITPTGRLSGEEARQRAEIYRDAKRLELRAGRARRNGQGKL